MSPAERVFRTAMFVKSWPDNEVSLLDDEWPEWTYFGQDLLLGARPGIVRVDGSYIEISVANGWARYSLGDLEPLTLCYPAHLEKSRRDPA